MPPIDTKSLFTVLQEMCPEVEEKTLVYLLSTSRKTVGFLLTKDSYWVNEKSWRKSAEKMNRQCVDEIGPENFREAGIKELIYCCPSPTKGVTSFEESIEDLISSIFTYFYDDDI